MRSSGRVRSGSDSCSCEACGRVIENPIKLTNLCAAPMQTYNACPFCFSKVGEAEALEEPNNMNLSASEEMSHVRASVQKNAESSGTPEHINCPHYFGYLKKRPRNASIPDTCLTCQKMIQCLL